MLQKPGPFKFPGEVEPEHVNVTGPRQRGVWPGHTTGTVQHPTSAIIAHCIRLRRKYKKWTKSVAVAVVVAVGPHWTSGFTAPLMGEG